MTYRQLPKKEAVKKVNKYRNKTVMFQGKKFDSILERERYFYLMEAQREGKIRDLRTQVRFSLDVGEHHICDYIADFVYKTIKPDYMIDVIEDTKGGILTDVYRLKEKLMAACLGLVVRIVRKPTEPV